jgi:hypothetical protein
MMFLDCPAYLDQDGAVRCGLPAEVRGRFTMRSTDGPVESAMIRCPAGHSFCGAIESLTCDNSRQNEARAASSAGHDDVTGRHDGPDGSDRFAIGNVSAEQEQEISARTVPLPTIWAALPACVSPPCARAAAAPPHPASAVIQQTVIVRGQSSSCCNRRESEEKGHV